jgi:hypothetical protein
MAPSPLSRIPFSFAINLCSKPSATDICKAVGASGEGATTRQEPFNQNAEEGVMRSTRARLVLENLETRSLLTTNVGFNLKKHSLEVGDL